MPDLREVFEMVKQQTEPDKDSWAEQERTIRNARRKRKYGALALVAALVLVIAVVVARDMGKEDHGAGPATDNGASIQPQPAGLELALLDIATGATTGTGIVPNGSAVDVSADGTRMTYVGSGDVVYVANIDGSQEHAFQQTDGPPGGAIAPRWSPDGTKIVYQGKGPGDQLGNLFVLDLQSGKVERITDLGSMSAGLYYMAPGFSADGRSVLFTMPTRVAPRADGSDEWGVWSVPADGGQPTLLQRNAAFPDAQPGGDLITFSKIDDRENAGDLYVARSDGSDARKLVEGATNLPRWSPDGSQIAFSDDGRDAMVVVDLATGETQHVWPHGEWPEWVDADTMIIDLSD
jgi:dipeptidyl aminopeptidase/acylaminoacyl peptidase